MYIIINSQLNVSAKLEMGIKENISILIRNDA